MDFTQLETQLYKISSKETYYRKNPELPDSYATLKKEQVNGIEAYLFNKLIPENQEYQIVKQNRFMAVPIHIHNCIELNYMYSGSCTQHIDGKKVQLKAGQICLIDTSIPHSIDPTGEQDLLINILVKKDCFRKQLTQESFEDSVLADFILDAISEKQTHRQYIVFKNNQHDRIHLIIQQILLEHYQPSIGSSAIIEKLISILCTLLIREFDYETNKKQRKNKEQMIQILQYIENHYLEITLEELADMFSYSPAYLSTLIRKETSKNFTELVIERRLEHARELITQSALPIYQIAAESGFSNITFFYKKYAQYFGYQPGATLAHLAREQENQSF